MNLDHPLPPLKDNGKGKDKIMIPSYKTHLYSVIKPTGCHSTIRWMALHTVHNCIGTRRADLQWLIRKYYKSHFSRSRIYNLPASSPWSILINLPVRFSQINHLPSSLPLATYSPATQSNKQYQHWGVKGISTSTITE